MAGGTSGCKARKKQNHVMPFENFHKCTYCRRKKPTYAAAIACRAEDLKREREKAKKDELEKKKKQSKKTVGLGGSSSSKKKVVRTCIHCQVVYPTMEEAEMCEKSHID